MNIHLHGDPLQATEHGNLAMGSNIALRERHNDVDTNLAELPARIWIISSIKLGKFQN